MLLSVCSREKCALQTVASLTFAVHISQRCLQVLNVTSQVKSQSPSLKSSPKSKGPSLKPQSSSHKSSLKSCLNGQVGSSLTNKLEVPSKKLPIVINMISTNCILLKYQNLSYIVTWFSVRLGLVIQFTGCKFRVKSKVRNCN